MGFIEQIDANGVPETQGKIIPLEPFLQRVWQNQKHKPA